MADDPNAQPPPRVSVTFAEIEAQIAADKAAGEKPKLGEIKIDGEGIPDDLKGKTVAELLTMTKGLSDSLRVSEQRRQDVERAALTARQPVPEQKPPEPEPELSDEQVAELFDKKPLEAVKYLSARAAKTAEDNLNKRLGGLVSGGASAAEQSARTKYPDEFELFDDQIKAALNSGMVKKEAMTQPEAWDDLIAWIRGKTGNMEKLFDHRVAKASKGKQTDAQAAQAAAAGPVIRTTVGGSSGGSAAGELDDTMKEIARNLFPDMAPADAYKEYDKWRRVA